MPFTVLSWGNRALPERILEAVWGFFSAYALVFIVSMLAIIATGVDDFSAFASVVATLNNLGPGLGWLLITSPV